MRLHFFNSAVIMNSKLDYCPFLENDLSWRLRHNFLLLGFFVARRLSKFFNKIVTEMLSWNLKYSAQQSLSCLNEIILFSLFHFFILLLFFIFVNKGLKIGSVVMMKENILKAWPYQCYFYFFHLTRFFHFPITFYWFNYRGVYVISYRCDSILALLQAK